MFDLPSSALVDRFIAKTKFYEHTQVASAIKDEFINAISRITWAYKLAESTINVPPTSAVEEIQIFEVELKQKTIPQKALSIIDRSIPYPILFVLKYEKNTCCVMQHKTDSAKRYYKTEWNDLPDVQFTGQNLESIYQSMITSFITVNTPEQESGVSSDESFEETVKRDAERQKLEKEIAALERKMRAERQFSRKVELNNELQRKKKMLRVIL